MYKVVHLRQLFPALGLPQDGEGSGKQKKQKKQSVAGNRYGGVGCALK
jgi:hypothetical protein